MINGPDRIFVERHRKLERVSARFENKEAVLCGLRQVGRQRDGSRKITHITEVAGFDADSGRYRLNDLYVLEHGAASGPALLPTGQLPTFAERLIEHGVELPAEMLRAAHARDKQRG